MLGEATIERVVDQFYEWLPQQPEFNLFFNCRELLEHVKKQQKLYWVDFFKSVVVMTPICNSDQQQGPRFS